MEVPHRGNLTILTPVLILLTLLLHGCNPENQDLTEEIPTPAASPERVPTEEIVSQMGNTDKILFDFDHTSSGLTLDSGGDVDVEVVIIGELGDAFRTGNGRVLPSADRNTVPDWYMQFQIDDDFMFQGSPTSKVRIEVEYLDDGTDQFNIQYDASSGGPFGNGQFKETDVVVKTGTGDFKTAIFTLSDAYFANRDNNADFRISDFSDGAETIRRVIVTLLPDSLETIRLPTETPWPSAEITQSGQAELIFYNGAVLTMEDESVVSAIAVKGERILDVGDDESILALAGPGTKLVDLDGLTLMPGFVDAHSHHFSNPWRSDFEGGQAYLLSNGITTIAEMLVEEELIQELQAFEKSEKLHVRVSLYPSHVNNCGEILGDWYSLTYPVTREPGAMLQIPGIKIFNDGGSCNRPAVSYEYPNGGGQGDLYFQVDELAEMIIAAQEQGYQVAIHGLGDRAIEVNLDSIEKALAGEPNTYRHRIEHNTMVRDDMLHRYTEIDVVALIFGSFPACFFNSDSDQYKYITPDEYREWEWRWRSLIDANPKVHFAWHADTPPMGDPVPLKHLFGFVTREQIMDDGTFCEPPHWAIDDRLTVEEALPLMTIESAYAILRDDEIGSLKAGKLADLIVLSANPLEVDSKFIPNIQVLMTMVGGIIEYCAQGHSSVCP
jgi:predicted amidohydrolase YtcJ